MIPQYFHGVLCTLSSETMEFSVLYMNFAFPNYPSSQGLFRTQVEAE